MTRKKKTLPPPPSEKVGEVLEWTTEPTEEALATAIVHTWATMDGKYQVKRLQSIGLAMPAFGAQYSQYRDSRICWDIFESDKRSGPGYPRYYKSLEEAMVSVEIFHLKRSKKETVKTNMEEVLVQARKLGLDGGRPARAAVSTESGAGETLKVHAPRTRSEGKMGCLDAAVLTLQEENRPMDLKELITLMSERGYWTTGKGLTPWATLGAAIGVAQRAGDTRFVKVGRGLFQASK